MKATLLSLCAGLAACGESLPRAEPDAADIADAAVDDAAVDGEPDAPISSGEARRALSR